mgnify:CR=1 FL=1
MDERARRRVAHVLVRVVNVRVAPVESSTATPIVIATRGKDMPAGAMAALILNVPDIDAAIARATAAGAKLMRPVAKTGEGLSYAFLTDPDGNALAKELTLGVRAASAPVTTAKLIPIKPGETVTLDASYFDGLVAHTSSLTLAVGPIARLGVPQLLMQLDRYPYGCAEQVSSRALPLLYLNDVARMIGLGTDDALSQRIKDATRRLRTHAEKIAWHLAEMASQSAPSPGR